MSYGTGNCGCGCQELVQLEAKKSLPMIEDTQGCGDGSCGCGCGEFLEEKENKLPG